MNTVEDELALRKLMSIYVDAVNRSDAQSWISTWTEDAVWNLLGNDVAGRDNILALWQQMMAGFEFAIMMPASCLFDVRGDTASGHWYLQEYTRDKEGNTGTILSHYRDEYVRQDGAWLYRSRRYSIMYQGDGNLGGSYMPLAS